MARWLKQSTAKTLRFGPFLDETDGKTAETGLTISQADIRLSKNGGAFAQTNDSSGATHDENGWYSLQLDGTDTNTLGPLTVAIHESGALPVWEHFMVVPANEYDSLVSGSDALQVDAVEISGDSTAADNAEAAFDGTGYAFTNCTMPTVTTLTGHTAQTGDSFARIGANGASLTSVGLSTAAQQDIAQGRNARNTWFVNKSGDDGNSGTSWDDAFLTIGAAVSAASAGDMILIGSGTYSEAVDASGTANLEFVGAGIGTYINTTSQIALRVGSGTVVRALKAESSHTSAIGFYPAGADDVTAIDCVFVGKSDALACSGARLKLIRCHGSATYDGANLNGADEWYLEDCVLETDGTHASALRAAAIYADGTASGHMRGGALISRRNAENAYEAIGFASDDAAGRYILEGVQIVAEQSHASATGHVCGVSASSGAGSLGNILLRGCTIYTSQAGSGNEYHLNRASETLAVDAATIYDTNKTNGTITVLAEIGTGAGFTAQPWNSAWDAEVQSEVQDALVANNLDHLMKTAVANNADMTTEVADGTVLSNLMTSDSDTSGYDRTTDSLEALRDHIGDGTNLTEAGGDGDHLTEAGGTGDHLTALATASTALSNATWTDARAGYVDELAAANLPTDVAAVSSAISGLNDPTAAAIADAVLDEAMSGHTSAGSLGLFINDIYDLDITGITSGVEGRAGKHSLAGIVMIGTNSSVSGTTLTAKKPSDDSTFQTYTVTVDAAADPITGVS